MTDDTDWIKEERRHERDMFVERERRDASIRMHRTDRIKAVATGLTISVIVVALAVLIGVLTTDHGARTFKLEQACIESGGTWGSLNSGGDTCLRGVGK